MMSNPDSSTAVVNFGEFILNMDMGRYSFIICQILKFSGLRVVVKLDPKFFNKKAPYREMLLAQDFIKVRNTSTEAGTIELHGESLRKKTIKLEYGYGLIQNRINAYYLPYTLHPRFYQTFSENTNFQLYRSMERKNRIFFAGNFDRTQYSRSILKADFEGIISRVEVLDHIKATYSEDPRVIYASTKKDLYESLKTKQKVNQLIISEVKTPAEDWLPILSKNDFYLCLPGGAMPLSHNAFEAMALGTIPILQYKDLFYPALEHLKNCLAYSTFDTLDAAIETALNMNEQEVFLMKQAVVEYYDKYLATERTIETIHSFLASEEATMTIAMPFLPKR